MGTGEPLFKGAMQSAKLRLWPRQGGLGQGTIFHPIKVTIIQLKINKKVLGIVSVYFKIHLLRIVLTKRNTTEMMAKERILIM